MNKTQFKYHLSCLLNQIEVAKRLNLREVLSELNRKKFVLYKIYLYPNVRLTELERSTDWKPFKLKVKKGLFKVN